MFCIYNDAYIVCAGHNGPLTVAVSVLEQALPSKQEVVGIKCLGDYQPIWRAVLR